MYDVWIYFAGPESRWSGKMSARETIAHHVSPWLWLAKMKAKATLKDLNEGRCGAVIINDDAEVLHIEHRTNVSKSLEEVT
jgi:hypothetical protein